MIWWNSKPDLLTRIDICIFSSLAPHRGRARCRVEAVKLMRRAAAGRGGTGPGAASRSWSPCVAQQQAASVVGLATAQRHELLGAEAQGHQEHVHLATGDGRARLKRETKERWRGGWISAFAGERYSGPKLTCRIGGWCVNPISKTSICKPANYANVCVLTRFSRKGVI